MATAVASGLSEIRTEWPLAAEVAAYREEQRQRASRDLGRDLAYGECFCGCGARTTIVEKSSQKSKILKGEPRLYVQGHGGRQLGPEYEVDPITGCWVWQKAKDREGYGLYFLDCKRHRAHRYFYEQAKGPIPDGWHVHHECRNVSCVNPAHLIAMRPAEHMRTRKSTRLTIHDARAIRAVDRAFLCTKAELGQAFGVGGSVVSAIVGGRTWRE